MITGQLRLPMIDPDWYWPTEAALKITLACALSEPGITPSWVAWYRNYYDSMVVMREIGLAYVE
jgi:hypothetical protein